MRERVEQVGGTLSVDSGPQGAMVVAEIPIAAQPGSVDPDGRPSASVARTAGRE